MDGEDIKSMKLYNFIDRVYNELKELGKEIEGDLSINELSSFDQLHSVSYTHLTLPTKA